MNEMKTNSKPVEVNSFVNGKVFGTYKLNVRAEPSLSAKVLRVVGQDDRLLVDSSYISTEWCKIRLGADTFGYSLKQYVKF